MIVFNKPPQTGAELGYIEDALQRQSLSGDGYYTKQCEQWFEANLAIKRVLLTSSCTHALEMAAILADIQPGDEVIMPSYTFVSTANAFVLRGATIVFVDIRPDTLNIDETLIEQAITKRTKAIVPVHYAGVSCDMATIGAIAKRHNLAVIEDAAQACLAKYQGRYVGSQGDVSTLSFHDTKNFTSGGEGGALLINNEAWLERAEILRQKGTNRKQFLRGEVDKYSWVDLGSSYLQSELQAAYLFAQMQNSAKIQESRQATWQQYAAGLQDLQRQERISLTQIPNDCEHNAHLFYLLTRTEQERDDLIAHLRAREVYAVHHYVPLHSSAAGMKFGRFAGVDRYTTSLSSRLIRLPLFYGLLSSEVDYVISVIDEFYATSKLSQQHKAAEGAA